MIKIPNQNQFSQTNESDRAGNIYITKNVHFDKRGYISLADRTVGLGNSVGMADLLATGKYISAIAYEGNLVKYWIAGSKNLYHSSTLDANTWTKDAGTGTPTLDQFGRNDLINWEGRLYACNGANIYYKDQDTTNVWTVFNSFGGQIMRVFENLNQLAVSDGANVVITLDNAGNEIQRLTLPVGVQITSMAWSNLKLYISTYDSIGGGVIYEWDGVSDVANNLYPVDASTVYALTPYKSGVAGTTSKGELIYCQGGIQTLAYFPIYSKDFDWFSTFGVYQRGMLAQDDKIYIAVAPINSNSSRDENRPRLENDFIGGVWCYDPKVGLYNKYNIGSNLALKTNAITTGNVDTTTEIITVAGVTVPPTGTPVFYQSNNSGTSTAIGGLKDGIKYYTIKVTDSTLRLATTKANADAGTAINLTGTGNNDQFLTFTPNTDFGGIFVTPTCLHPISLPNFFGRTMVSDILIGSTVQIGTATTDSQASILSVGKWQENRGYVITPKSLSKQLTDNTKSLSIKFKKLLTEEDKIIIKYRRKDEDKPRWLSQNSPAITWTSSTTFTSTDDLSAVAVGDEVEITKGSGAGYLAHVTVISENAGTYTVTIDETIQNIAVNDRAYVVFDNWTKIKTITNTSDSNDDGYDLIRIAEPSKWVQFKIELRGNGVQLEEIIIDNDTQLPLH